MGATSYGVSVYFGDFDQPVSLAAVEFGWDPRPEPSPETGSTERAVFRLRWLHRLPPGASGLDAAEAVHDFVRQNRELQGRTDIFVNSTGPSGPFLSQYMWADDPDPENVIELHVALRKEKRIAGLQTFRREKIIVAVKLALDKQILQIAEGLPLLDDLQRQIVNFRRVADPLGRYDYDKPQQYGIDLIVAVGMPIAYASGAGEPRLDVH